MICRNHVDVSEGVRRCARCGGTYCPDCLVTIQGLPYCAVCKSEQILDVRSGVDRSKLIYASVLKRFAAMLVDGFICAIPAYIFLFGVMFLTMDDTGEPSPLIFIGYIPLIFITPFYEALMMIHKNGQTLGKMALSIRVVSANGAPLTNGQAWGRSFMKLILGSCLSIINYIPALFTDEKTALHDMVATTRVVDTF
jgi:uncharacterized RDD family membrane protein YckC